MKFIFSFFIVCFSFLLLAGCTGSERYGSLNVTTDLAPGTVVRLETQGRELAYRTVATATVEVGGTLRFTRLMPGEYRLAVYNVNGDPIQGTLPFGVGAGETSITFITNTPQVQ